MKKRLEPTNDLHEPIADLQTRTSELTDDVRRLSRRLHPDIMEHVGLVVALKSYCAEFSKNNGISIHMNVPDRRRTGSSRSGAMSIPSSPGITREHT